MALSSWQRLANSTQIQRHYSEKPVGLAWRSNRGFIVATVAIGLITDLFLYAFFVPVLPFMLENQVGLPQDQVQSQVSNLLAAYAGASVAISPIAAIIADQFSTRQSPFLFGLGSLCGATVLLLKGQSMAVLMVARVLQGTSAALVWTVGLALCLETVGPENLGKTLGSVGLYPRFLTFGATN
jgi:MFS family permease